MSSAKERRIIALPPLEELKRKRKMTQSKSTTLLELTADEIAHVSGGSGMLGSGTRQDDGGTIGSGVGKDGGGGTIGSGT
jgi:hypothetical protein